jgi:hypothetical protein
MQDGVDCDRGTGKVATTLFAVKMGQDLPVALPRMFIFAVAFLAVIPRCGERICFSRRQPSRYQVNLVATSTRSAPLPNW